MKEIIDELDFIKIKNFCSVKGSVKRLRRQPTDWEKIFAKNIWKRIVIKNVPPPKKNNLKLNNKKTTWLQ